MIGEQLDKLVCHTVTAGLEAASNIKIGKARRRNFSSSCILHSIHTHVTTLPVRHLADQAFSVSDPYWIYKGLGYTERPWIFFE